ncbi:MAG TPA: bifunctional UDP-sugar hydrolase/5'-nucleotidase, partial [Candidatus Eisenbacteria bacterium]|nr:bifunctional UDP-sugar hydrolase/5'-nucleotidase [Candidatus Eisenbacteria bacterium]
MRMLRMLLAAALALLASTAAAETTHVILLHTTDLHGALTDWDYASDRPATRGLVRVATLVRRVRAEGAPVLLLDGGDAIQGGIELARRAGHATDTPDPMMRAMAQLGYDAMAVGNHEFDFGEGALSAARADAGFPWLSANVTRANGGPAFQPSLVRTAGGVRVGVVGLTTPAVPEMEDSSLVQGFRFQSPVEAATREVRRLREVEHCDVVVLLAHTGLERERADQPLHAWDIPDENWGYRLATQVPGVDVIVLGHTHAIVPAFEPSGAGGPLVTEAGRSGEALGRVDLELSRATAGARWTIERRAARVLAVTDSVPADSALAAYAAPLHAAAEAQLDRPVGSAAKAIVSPHGRDADGAVWELIQRAQLDASGADVSLAALPDPALALAPGAITARDLARLSPYENTLVTLRLTGAELAQVLEQSARAYLDYTFEDGRALIQPGWPGYDVDAAEGVSYEVDLTRPPGARIVNLAWKGQPLAPDQVLTVVTTSYRANGGGNVAALVHAPRVPGPAITVREALERYLAKSGPLAGEFVANWSLLPDYAATTERPLIDRLVRQGAAPRAEVMQLFPDEPARRGDLAYWLSRAFGWREKRLSGAFADVPDSLEPWLDGLLKRGVLGEQASAQYIEPFAPASVSTALDWCLAAARYEAFPIGDPGEFRRGLLTGTALARADGGPALAGASGQALLSSRPALLAAIASPTLPLT